ncbi:MAG: type II toxin-antitoxin system VapC family toxin [Deltaproteobacteria bacterium]|nr:type II toxin-antitoxin system VapC family toxin [Deltaproteobacteria bacterium]
MIVADTNLLAYFLIDGKETSLAERLFALDSEWIAPLLWKSEFRNLLSLYVRKNLMMLEKSFQYMKDAEYLMRNKAYEVESNQVLRLAQSSRCSAYDCEFVTLAKKFEIPLITLDKKILESFPETATNLNNFLKHTT